MKKLFIFFLALLLCQAAVVSAQDDESSASGGNLEAGDIIIEITGSPFDGSSLLNFGSFRGKYVVSETIVPRLGVSYSVSNSQSTPDIATNVSSYDLAPGVEYHLTSESKFSTYAALDILIGQRFSSYENATLGQSVDGSTTYPGNPNQNLGNRAYFRIGASLSVGADYYFSSRFYMGAEIGFQYARTMNKEVTVDGRLYQEKTASNTGSINRINSFKIGFKLF